MTGVARLRRPALRRLGSAALFVGAASAALALAGPDALMPFRDVAGAAAQVSVAFVIDFGGSGGEVVRCVNVPGSDNGYAALAALTQQEHLAAPVYNASGLLCSINDVPNVTDPSSQCGQIVSGGYAYWSFWLPIHGSPGTWSYATAGAFATVQGGNVYGWRFQNPGKANPSDPPPTAAPDYAAICPNALTSTTVMTTIAPSSQAPTTSAVPTAQAAQPPSSGAGVTSTTSPGDQPSAAGTTPTNSITVPVPVPGAGAGATTTSSPHSKGRTEAPVALTAAAHRPQGGSALPLLAGGLIIAALVGGAMLRWRKRLRTP